MPNIAAPISSTARYAPPRLRFSTSRGGSSGVRRAELPGRERGEQHHARARKPHVNGVCQLSAAALESP